MNDPVGIYMNTSKNSKGNSLLISLIGNESNYHGLGSRLTLKMSNGQVMNRMVTSSRGYMSWAEPVTHFGWLSSWEEPEELTIHWPSGHHQTVNNLEAGWHYQISENVDTKKREAELVSDNSLFQKVDDALGIRFEHKENFYDDFKSQPLLPNRLSRFGPALALGDIDGDGDEDVFLGAARDRESAIFMQNNGQFERVACPVLKSDQIYEDVDAIWLDVDNDGDLDLYVVSGGASQPAGHDDYQDRIYLNDGKGNLSKAPESAIPNLKFSGSRVTADDFDQDGDLDLFVGSRFVPGRYPTDPESVLLINQGGHFSRLDSPVNSSGMVTDAKWSDIDGDERPDLIVATEWGPVRVYQNKENGFNEITKTVGA